MFLIRAAHSSYFSRVITRARLIPVLALLLALCPAAKFFAQTPTPTPTPQKSGQPSGAPEAGGPQGDIGPIAVPKKKEEPPKKEEAPKAPQKIEGMPNFSMRVTVPLVTLDVGVLTKNGQFVPGLRKENFRILEDNVPQTITSFNQTEAPITAVMLVEFASTFPDFVYDAVGASYVFASTLKKEDWVALISYDIRPRILADFTQDKRNIYEGVRSLQIPMSSETNLFDALYDTIDRLETVEGRKYIILVSSGRDTFSKRTLDQMLKKIQNSKDIAIYAIGTGQALRNYAESRGMIRYLCGITSIDSCGIEWKQADNQLQSFARMTGGKAYFPLFQASFKDAFVDIAQTIRNQYSLAYHSTNPAQDGSYRKIKVELVAPDGGPLRIQDEKKHDLKVQIVTREGYRAKREVE